MRTSADERPLPPRPTWSLSRTTMFPTFRLARWNAIDAPMTPAPRITMSAVFGSELERPFAPLTRLPPAIVLSSSRATLDARHYVRAHRSRRLRDVRPLHTDRVRQWASGIATILVPVSYTHLRAHETVLDL